MWTVLSESLAQTLIIDLYVERATGRRYGGTHYVRMRIDGKFVRMRNCDTSLILLKISNNLHTDQYISHLSLWGCTNRPTRDKINKHTSIAATIPTKTG